ncbi:MAG TPA: SRPBCC domain-containing protein [Acidimicrobiia bacterium]
MSGDGMGNRTDEAELGSVRRSVVLPAPVETVWAAITDSGRLSAWLGGEVELDALPGGQIVVREDGRLRRGVVVDVEPLRRLEIQWLPASRRIGFVWGPDDQPAGTGGRLEFRLEPAEGDDGTQCPPAVDAGTRLTVIEWAPAPHPAGRPSALAVA